MNEIDKEKPIVGISVGDPAGIGPEIAIKALWMRNVFEICKPLIVAESIMIKREMEIAQIDLKINSISKPEDGKYRYGVIDLIDMKNINGNSIQHKTISPECGKASFEYIRKVIDLALSKEIDAVVTGPIHKESINRAGINYAGHTEMFAHFTGSKNYAMMLIHENFRVIHVSTHESLRKACDSVKKDRVYQVINLGNETLKRIGIKYPKIGVAGLNPHAGEDGLFGDEEIKEIKPAIDTAKKIGIDVEGPIAPDTVFSKMQGKKYDLVVAMYHDQGHIPTKVLGFKYDEKTNTWGSVSGINVTCGLPIIRASVDHGTAFGKAGEGRANPESMIQAIEFASRIAKK